jgi:hypothetical protein
MCNRKLVNDFKKLYSDDKVLCDLRKALDNGSDSYQVELETGVVTFHKDVQLSVVYRSLLENYCDLDIVSVKVGIGIGAVTRDEVGFVNAEYCFAKLHYDLEGSLVKIVFDEELV